jgi:hypothetical protein
MRHLIREAKGTSLFSLASPLTSSHLTTCIQAMQEKVADHRGRKPSLSEGVKSAAEFL